MTTSEVNEYLERMIIYLKLVCSKIRNIEKGVKKQNIIRKSSAIDDGYWTMPGRSLATVQSEVRHLICIKREGEKYIRLFRQKQNSITLRQILLDLNKVPNMTFILAPNFVSVKNPGRPKMNMGPLLICKIKISTKPSSNVELFGCSDTSVWVHKRGSRVLTRHDICGGCRIGYVLDMVPKFVSLTRDHIVYVDESKTSVYKKSSKGTQKLITVSAKSTHKLMTNSDTIITAISPSSDDSLLVCTCNMKRGKGEIRKYDLIDGILASSISLYDFFRVLSVTENIDGSVWFVSLLCGTEVRQIFKLNRCFTERKDAFVMVKLLDHLPTICPVKITHNSIGDILILDCSKREVHIVNNFGRLIWSVHLIGCIESICVDPSDKLWVIDSDGMNAQALGCYKPL
jgi:hypothetical protein